MDLTNLFKSSDYLKQIKGIEGNLRLRKRAESISRIAIIAGIILQSLIEIIRGNEEYTLKNIGTYLIDFGSFVREVFSGNVTDAFTTYEPVFELVGIVVIAIAFALYILLKKTQFLLRYSEEPFRYTFWIEPFQHVRDTKNNKHNIEVDRDDRFHHLVHHDLMERLNDRIRRRLSLLNPQDLDLSVREGLSSHIQVTGHYTLREEQDGECVIHVMPRIAIGPPGSPATLAESVKFEIGQINQKDQHRIELDANTYNQIIERIYSSVTTEIYNQIRIDLKEKISLFPTKRLRAVALFYEAEDFARSNTVDAYDLAITLYKEALRYFNIVKIKWMTKFLIKLPLPLWCFEVRFSHMEAKVQTGYAKCLIYRRRISALSGRYRNPLFEIPSKLDEMIVSLKKLHYRISRNRKTKRYKGKNRLYSLIAYLTFPEDSWIRRLSLRPSESLFERQRLILFDAYVVNALAHYDLGAIKKAKKSLNDAKAVGPRMSERNSLYLLANALIEPDLDKEILLFQQATEVAPNFQIAQFFLAFYSEMRFRTQSEIIDAKARRVIEEYEKVLKINPGNIASLAAQGYILWLLEDPEKAKKKFEEGREIKAIVRETFVGELNYGLARIAAEEGRFNTSYALYTGAISANPEVGAYSVTANRRTETSYYDYIVLDMLKRYHRFKTTVKKLCDLKPEPWSIDSKFEKDLKNNSISKDLWSKFKAKKIRLAQYAKVTTLEENKQWAIEDEEFKVFVRKGNDKLKIDWERKASETIRKAVHSFALNDYGNACLNYYIRFGDRDQLKIAFKEFELAIDEYSDNAVAKYNFHACNIYLENEEEKGDKEASKIYLQEVVDKMPTWQDAVISFAQSKVREPRVIEIQRTLDKIKKDIESAKKSAKAAEIKVRNLEQEKRELDSRKVEVEDLDSLMTLYNPDKEIKAAQKEIKAAQDNAQEEKNKLEENLEKKHKLESDLKELIGEALRKIMENTKLSCLFEGLDIDYKGEGVDQLLAIQQIIKWERLDEDDAGTLKAWAEILSNSYLESEALKKSEKLCNHILKEYYPDNFDANWIRKQALELLSKLGEETKNILFSIKLHNKTNLTKSNIAEVLRPEFKNNDISLSQNNRLSIKEEGNSWVIADKDNSKTYFVREVKDKIYIYRPETDKCDEMIKPTVNNWIEQDPIHFIALRCHNMFFAKGEHKQVIKTAVRIEQDNHKYCHNLATVYSRNGRRYFWRNEYEKAIEQYEIASEIEPDNNQHYLDLAAVYNRIVNDYFPKDIAYHSNLARVYEELIDHGTKVQALDNAISATKMATEELDILKSIASCLSNEFTRSGDFDKYHIATIMGTKKASCVGYTTMIYILGNALELNVRAAQVRTCMDDRKFVKAEHTVALATLADNNNAIIDLNYEGAPPIVTFRLEDVFSKIGHWYEMRDEKKSLKIPRRFRLVDENGLKSIGYVQRGCCCFANKMVKEAVGCFAKACELDPHNSSPHTGIATILRGMKQFDAAEKAVMAAEELDDKDVKADFIMGRIQEDKGEYAKAREFYSRVITVDPIDPEAYFCRGRVQHHLGNVEESCHDFATAVEIDPSQIQRITMWKFVQTQMRDLDHKLGRT